MPMQPSIKIDEFSHAKNYFVPKGALLESPVRTNWLYSVQAWHLTKVQKEKLDAVCRGFLRKISRHSGQHKASDNGNLSMVISNEIPYSITKTVQLVDFIEKQFLKYQARFTHATQQPPKQLKFMNPEVRQASNLWTKCGKLIGGYSNSNAREIMQDRKLF